MMKAVRRLHRVMTSTDAAFRRRLSTLPSRVLGNTGIETSIIGLGGVGIGEVYGKVSEGEAVDCVIRALELGINLIDTSPNYGNGRSEERIGLAVNALAGKSSFTATTSTTIITKCGDNGPQNNGHSPFSKDGVHSSFKRSLKLLNPPSGTIDVLLLHDPSQEDLDEFFSPETGGYVAFQELRADKSIRATGIGVREHDVLLRFMEHTTNLADIIITVNDWNLIRRYAETELFPAATRMNIGVLNGGPLYMGLLSGVDPEKSFRQGVKSLLEVPTLVKLARRVKSWSDEQNLDLRALALHFAAGPGSMSPPIAGALLGARFASEVEELIGSLLLGCEKELEKYTQAAKDFEETFGAEIRQFNPESHFYYDKSKIDL
mmetsp:Transcript_14837/g.24796  ORF Transcript_14837/g.24796 Transcript_14837/m.24796 type:complete len:376 (+) Transcript_14837:45-1172(+)